MVARFGLGILFATAVPLLSAGEAARSYSGRILDVSTPVAGAVVTISAPAFLESVTTDDNGIFVFSKVPPGRYDFRTTAHGFAVFECPVVVRRNGDRRNRIEVKNLVRAEEQIVSVADLAGKKQNPTRTRRAVSSVSRSGA